MNPLLRFHSIVLSVTTLSVFYLWEVLTNITNDYPNLKIALAAVTSIGIYRLFVELFKVFLLKIRFIKKWIFGAYYLEGVWVGFFIGVKGKERFYIETFEQDFDSLVIRGKGFRKDGSFFGSWISDSTNIDVKKGVLNYTYQADALRHSFINPGLANFVIERDTKSGVPKKLIGFSSDLYNPQKLKSLETKLHDKPKIIGFDQALQEARKVFKDHKDFF